MISFLKTNILNQNQKDEVIDLWNEHYPQNLYYNSSKDFDEYLADLEDPKHILLMDDEKIMGWYIDFQRENERWFAMIIHHSIQGMGYGAVLLHKGQKENKVLNGWVIESSEYKLVNGVNYRTPMTFYLRYGFEVIPEKTLEAKGLKMVKIRWKK